MTAPRSVVQILIMMVVMHRPFQLIRPLPTALVVATLMLLTAALAPAQGPPPANVAVEPVTREAVREGVTLIGTVEAFQASTVAAQAEGRVLKLSVRTGDRVKKGAPLATLDATQNEIQLAQAKAQAAASQVQLSQDEADLELANKLLPSQAVSTDLVSQRERIVLQSRQELARHEAEVERLKFLVRQATIRAPFSGTVSQELAQAGEWLSEGGGIVRLVDLSTARVTVWVPENTVGRLKQGDTVSVDTEAGAFTGKLHAIIPDGDPKSRTFPVEVWVSNNNGRLFAGMQARVTFGVGEATDSLTVPRDAVVTRGSSSHLWKVVDGTAVRVPVTMGHGSGDRVAVTPAGELAEGDMVITRGNERVRDGQAVTVAGN